MTDLEYSHAQLRAAVIVAARRINKLSFGRRDDPTVAFLRHVLREARKAARAAKAVTAEVKGDHSVV